MSEIKDDYSKILNTFVQKRRKAMTEQDMANALEVSKATISNFEANKRSVKNKHRTMKKLLLKLTVIILTVIATLLILWVFGFICHWIGI